jgi:hypothetical protein
MVRVLGGSAVAMMMALMLAACGGGSGKKTVKVCTANATSCLNDSVALTCTADGAALIPTQCGSGQKCTAGVCTATPGAPCTSADNSCTDATHAVVCSAMGATAVSCPTGTQCEGPGLCQGSCVVGSSMCLDNGTVSTCNDGHTFTSTACASGKACVVTGTAPMATAACKTSACTPDPNGCNFVCGDKTGTAGSNAASTLSSCVSTPNGYEWVAITCPSPQTCDPFGQACSSGSGAQAGCDSVCTPGATRCTGVASNGYQTCGTDGTWSATVTACNADPTNAPYVCFPGNSGNAICGDLACAAVSGMSISQAPTGAGACDATGQFHLCGTDGKVSSTGAACASGTCIAIGSGLPGTYKAGACAVECQNGATQCVDGVGGSFQTCTNGLWGAATECAMGTSCFDTVGTNGLPSHACGDCLAGTHKCGATSADIETCGTDGTWGPDTACTVGACIALVSDAACIGQCFPGKTVCIGATVTVPDVGVSATDTQATCSATGSIPTTGTACTTGSYCRNGPAAGTVAGNSLGCVVCVGTQNEYGLPDTRCENVGDTASGEYVEQCLADNSGWDITNHVMCSGDNPTCQPATTGTTLSTAVPVCQLISFGTVGNLPVTQSNLEQFAQLSCAAIGGDTTTPCALASGGGVPDCCSSYCTASAAVPAPAYCN